MLCCFNYSIPVRYCNRQGHEIIYYPTRTTMKLLVNGRPFAKDTMKRGWAYWRCCGYRKSGFFKFIINNLIEHI